MLTISFHNLQVFTEYLSYVSMPNLKSKHVGLARPLPLHYDVPVGRAVSIGPYRLPQTYIKEDTAHRPTGS